MDYDGGKGRKNPKALVGSLVVIVVLAGLVIWVAANALRENMERQPEIGPSHTHSRGGGGHDAGPAPTAPPIAGPEDAPAPGAVPTPAPAVDLSAKGAPGGAPVPDGAGDHAGHDDGG